MNKISEEEIPFPPMLPNSHVIQAIRFKDGNIFMDFSLALVMEGDAGLYEVRGYINGNAGTNLIEMKHKNLHIALVEFYSKIGQWIMVNKPKILKTFNHDKNVVEGYPHA